MTLYSVHVISDGYVWVRVEVHDSHIIISEYKVINFKYNEYHRGLHNIFRIWYVVTKVSSKQTVSFGVFNVPKHDFLKINIMQLRQNCPAFDTGEKYNIMYNTTRGRQKIRLTMDGKNMVFMKFGRIIPANKGKNRHNVGKNQLQTDVWPVVRPLLEVYFPKVPTHHPGAFPRHLFCMFLAQTLCFPYLSSQIKNRFLVVFFTLRSIGHVSYILRLFLHFNGKFEQYIQKIVFHLGL